MSQVSEIKCSVCGEWCKWNNQIDEKCPHCQAYLDPGRYQYAQEKKSHTEANRQSSYLLVNDTDDPIVQMAKQFFNWLRWGTIYGVSVLVFIVAILLVAFGLVFV